jgi:hypothetical protein
MIGQVLVGHPRNTRWVVAQSIAGRFSSDPSALVEVDQEWWLFVLEHDAPL